MTGQDRRPRSHPSSLTASGTGRPRRNKRPYCWRHLMKYVVIASACAALLATPALAQSNYDQGDNPAASAAAPQGCSTLPDAAPDEPCPSSVSSAKLPAPNASLTLATDHATGTISSIDVAANTIILEDGKMFSVPANVAS